MMRSLLSEECGVIESYLKGEFLVLWQDVQEVLRARRAGAEAMSL
jgi:hypothetical protein